MNLITNDVVVGLVRAVWPMFANGKQAEIERLKRASSCRAIAMVLFDQDANRWHVFVDESLSPRDTMHYLAHEAGHVHLEHTPLDADAAAVRLMRRVFTEETPLFEWFEHQQRWDSKATDKRAQAREAAANQFAERFCDQWWPLLEKVEQAGREALIKILREVK